jgi:glycosyltransferase involved in cell wall biosynthesis
MSLALTGYPEGWTEVQKDFGALPVFHLGFVHEGLLRALFEGAQAVVFFSLYEGFGIPLLEAFDAGTPVICSSAGSLPEVGAGAVLACEATDVEAMSDLMERVVIDRSVRARLIAAGRERLACYSWEQSARNLVAACERVARRPSERAGATTRVGKTEEPLVSIVTPSFNQGRFLAATIESVLGQTYPNIEYFVIDAGSTDNSLEVLRSYGCRIAWLSERDRGQTDGINKGFSYARGEILGYLNSDDVLLPDAVATAVEHFGTHPESDLVYGKANYIDEDGEVTGEYPTDEYSFERLMEDCCICQPAAFWRARIARKIGPFDDSLNFVMDYEYWLRMDRAGGRLVHLADTLACSRRYAATKTLSHRREIYDEIFRVCLRHGGHVHLNYFLGRWHHEFRERRNGWASFRGIPAGWYAVAWLHHKWFHGRSRAVGRALAAEAIWWGRRVPGGERALGLAHGLRQRLADVRRAVARRRTEG